MVSSHDNKTILNQQPNTETLKFVCRHGSLAGQHLSWLHSESRLSEEDCDEIIELCREFPLSPPSIVGEDDLPDRRQLDMRKVGVNAKTQWIFDLFCAAATAANEAGAGLELTEINRAPQYCEYQAGKGHFDWHDDYSHDLEQAPRKFTVILQLSPPDDYVGGNLQAFGTEIENLPRERGSILAFPSFLPHRVTPVTKGTRKALVAWIAGPRVK